MRPLDLVLQRLDKLRATGERQWSALCPAHADRGPSLSISIGDDGRVLLHCHAGCTFDSIYAAMGIAVGDLFPSGSQQARPRPASPSRGFDSVDVAVRAVKSIVQRERGPTWNLAESY